jgi:hypothetical protein
VAEKSSAANFHHPSALPKSAVGGGGGKSGSGRGGGSALVALMLTNPLPWLPAVTLLLTLLTVRERTNCRPNGMPSRHLSAFFKWLALLLAAYC